ncbi:SDR family oxidoreductase, partial [uncultured Selenomonas sp.]
MEIAIITGASSGLGTWYARLLDNEGLDEIWLVARREKRLATIAQLLTTRTRILACDLTDPSSIAGLAHLLAETEQPEVRWLINAAGFGRISSCAELPADDAARMVDLNCRAAVLLTGAALPFMGAGSHIMNICSCAAFQPLPSLALYAATKAFLLSYTRALSSELAPQGILVTAVCP